MRNVFLLFLVFFIQLNGFTQDVHLSQYYTNQQNLNPALAGDYDGSYRLVANHRNQWRQIGGEPITTTALAFDQKFHFYSDEIDGGILIIQDEFAGLNLKTNKYLLTASYKKVINYHELRAGFQAGLTTRSTDLTSQTFPNQWVYQEGVFDGSLDNGESTLNENQNFFDLNVGVAWSKQMSRMKPSGGISLFHINTPKDSYFDDPSAQLKMRSLVHGAIEFQLKNKLTLEPRLMYMWTSKAQNSLVGGNISKGFDHFILKSVYAGALYRSGINRIDDAIIPIVGLEYKTVNIGFSYDSNLNSLSDYTSRKGTYEISFIYTAPAFIPKKLSIPCNRF